MDALITIGEFSARSGISPSRLRSYAARGLLVPVAVDAASGYRYYSARQLVDAELVDALRAAGMPVADVAAFLADRACERLDAWAGQVEADAAERRRAVEIARHLVGAMTNRASTAPAGAGEEHTMRLSTACRTDIGHVRATNQDAVVTTDRLAAVADGMGGPPGGEEASTTALALVAAAFTGRSADELAAGVRAANRAVWDRAQSGDGLEGMGTTVCAAALTDDGALVLVNVGDSRTCRLRDGVLAALTEDHSVTADLVRRGELREEDARDHPHHAVLTRALGVGPDVEIDTVTDRPAAGDRLLVATDGLLNEVLPDELETLLAEHVDPEAAADALVDLALARGGHDNVSLVVADVVA